MAKKSTESTKTKDLPRARERAGALCLAFANTGVPRRDDRRKDSKTPPSMPLATYSELVTWGQRMGFLTGDHGERLRRIAAERPEDAAAVCARAVKLRSVLIRIFTSRALGKEPGTEDLAAVNAALHPRRVVPAVGGFDWDWADGETLDRPLWVLARSAARLLTSDKLEKVTQCASAGCFQLFVSRSRRRLWCDANTCGNRLKGRRHQQRLRNLRKQLTWRTTIERQWARQAREAAAKAAASREAATPTSPAAPQESESSQAEEATASERPGSPTNN